jgi:threonine dehydratase
VIEPSAAVGVAAILAGRVGGSMDRATVCVLCGGNVDLARLPWSMTKMPNISKA